MTLDWHKLGTKLRLALLGTAALSILAFMIAFLPILMGSIREDRIKLFVEKSTRALAETLSHNLENYAQRVEQTAADLALMRGRRAEELRVLNSAAREPVAGLLPHGIFDLLVVLDRDGTILFANTQDRFGRPLASGLLSGRHISEFAGEEKAFLGALSGTGKQDWFRSRMVELAGVSGRTEDTARQFAYALAVPVPSSDRVLLAVVNWEAVQRVLDNIEPQMREVGFPSGYAFMFGRDANTIIAHKYRAPGSKNNYGTRLIEEHTLPSLAQAARLGRPSHRYEYPPGTRKISGLFRIDDPELGWTVGVGINDSDVIAPIFALTWRLALLGALVFVAAVFGSRFLSRRMTLGLLELRDTALRIAEGRFGERVPVRSRDEIGQLARAFNQMSAALAERDALIHRQQEQLFRQARLDQEVRIAAEVQRRLFPQVFPPLLTLDYAGFCQPARGVSGDYYDFVPVAPGKLALVVADVAGKGLSAALVMASLHACVRTHAALVGERCAELAARVNGLLYESTDDARYATIFYGIYDDAARSLVYVNAGHNPPLLVRAGQTVSAGADGGVATLTETVPACRALEVVIPPVGLFPSLAVAEQRVQLESGEWLIIYSDGLTEAINGHGEEFGVDRLAAVVSREQNHGATAGTMRDAIVSAVRAHTGDHPQADDITLIVARVL
jgi:serine phosphatase RsbU (regulator of sigma subunit)